MKKNAVRDYAVDCFRLYETLKRNENMLNNDKYQSLRTDYNAVKRTFEIVKKKKNGSDIAKAVKLVYCKRNASDFKKNEISQNVFLAADELFCSEMTIYRYLKCARDTFCSERGLRCERLPAEFT